MRQENRSLAEGSPDASPSGINPFMNPEGGSKVPEYVSNSMDGRFCSPRTVPDRSS